MIASVSRRALLIGVASLLAAPAVAAAQKPDRVVFGANWRAQAEHGGFYQAVATGLYCRRGLEVTIRQGGPQINSAQLLAAGRLDFKTADDIKAIVGHALQRSAPWHS